MILQFNGAGSWRNCVEFDAARMVHVQRAAANLARAVGSDKFRITCGDDGKALYLTDAWVGRWETLEEMRARKG